MSASAITAKRSALRAPPRLDRVASSLLPFMFVPTYEYECPKCPRVFEVRQRITEPALTTCDRCGGPIHRLLSATPAGEKSSTSTAAPSEKSTPAKADTPPSNAKSDKSKPASSDS